MPEVAGIVAAGEKPVDPDPHDEPSISLRAVQVVNLGQDEKEPWLSRLLPLVGNRKRRCLIKWSACGTCDDSASVIAGFFRLFRTCRQSPVSTRGVRWGLQIRRDPGIEDGFRRSIPAGNPKFEIRNSNSILPCTLSQGCYSYQLRWDGGWLA